MAEDTTARIGTPQRTMLRDSLRARITDLILPRVHKQLKAADASLPRQGDFESMFKAYDKNRDGVLQFSELQMAVRQDLGLDSSAVKNRDLKLLFDALDSDGGGTVGVDEWVRFLKADVDEDALSYNKTHRGTSVYSAASLGTGKYHAARKKVERARIDRIGRTWSVDAAWIGAPKGRKLSANRPRLTGARLGSSRCQGKHSDGAWYPANVEASCESGSFCLRFDEDGALPLRALPMVSREHVRKHDAVDEPPSKYAHEVGEECEVLWAPNTNRWYAATVASHAADDGAYTVGVAYRPSTAPLESEVHVPRHRMRPPTADTGGGRRLHSILDAIAAPGGDAAGALAEARVLAKVHRPAMRDAGYVPGLKARLSAPTALAATARHDALATLRLLTAPTDQCKYFA